MGSCLPDFWFLMLVSAHFTGPLWQTVLTSQLILLFLGMPASNVLGQEGLAFGSIFEQAYYPRSEVGDWGDLLVENMWIRLLAYLPKWDYRISSMVAWVHSPLGRSGAMDYFLCHCWAAERAPEPAWLVVKDQNQGRLCNEFPDQMEPLVFLCRWRVTL